MSRKDKCHVVGLYPKALADTLKDRAGQKYKPGNGTEGIFFYEWFCGRCAKQALCEIQGLTMLFRPEDEEYPQEWQYGQDGQPVCTAFEKRT